MPPFASTTTSVIRPSPKWLDECSRWLIDRRGMAEFLGIRINQVPGLHNSGRLPLPIRFANGPLRYAVPELSDWVRMGCPRIEEWMRIRGMSGSELAGNWGRSPTRLAGLPNRGTGPGVELRE